MGKYTIHSTKEDYEVQYEILRKLENSMKTGKLRWDKIKRQNLDALLVTVSIIERQIARNLIQQH